MSTNEIQPAKGAWRLVAVREMMVKLTDKNFVVSTVLTLALLLGIFGVQALLSGRPSTDKIAVLDDRGTQVVQVTHERMHAEDSNKTLVAEKFTDRGSAESALRSGTAVALLARDGDHWRLTSNKAPDERLSRELSTSVRNTTMAEKATAAGTSLEALTAGSRLDADSLTGESGTAELLRRIVGMAFAMLFYMAALMFGMQIASSVIEEKQSRIVEILATAIPVRQLLTGKIVGNTALAMGQMTLYVTAGFVGLTLTGKAAVLPGIAGSLVWFLAFFLAGFVALACVWAVAGALASRYEDLQSTTSPVTMILVVVFIIGFSVDGATRVVASYVPILSAIVMPQQVLAGDVSWWQPVLSLAVTLVFAVCTVLVGERLYRRAVMQSRRLKAMEAWKASA